MKHISPPSTCVKHISSPSVSGKNISPPSVSGKHISPPSTSGKQISPSSASGKHISQLDVCEQESIGACKGNVEMNPLSENFIDFSFLTLSNNVLNNVDICQICHHPVTDKVSTMCCQEVSCRFCIEVMTDIYTNICHFCNKESGGFQSCGTSNKSKNIFSPEIDN